MSNDAELVHTARGGAYAVLPDGRLLAQWSDGHVRCSHTPEEFHALFIVGARRDGHDPGDEDGER